MSAGKLAEQVRSIIYSDATDDRGCLDGGCLVKRPTGMHTNSATCYCVDLSRLPADDRVFVRRLLRERMTLIRAALEATS